MDTFLPCLSIFTDFNLKVILTSTPSISTWLCVQNDKGEIYLIHHLIFTIFRINPISISTGELFLSLALDVRFKANVQLSLCPEMCYNIFHLCTKQMPAENRTLQKADSTEILPRNLFSPDTVSALLHKIQKTNEQKYASDSFLNKTKLIRSSVSFH